MLFKRTFCFLLMIFSLQFAVFAFASDDVSNVDQTCQSAKPACKKLDITMKAEKKYLNFPINNSAVRRDVNLLVDGKSDYFFVMEIADPGEADFWVYMDISRYKGKQIKLVATPVEGSSDKIFEQLFQSDQPKDSATFYTEKYRPKFHFTSRRGWLNDSNGLVYYKGKYHLFYQHNPYGTKWANMHWGHAVSTDMVNWHELGEALYPDELGAAFSGSAVVDWNNTSGLKNGKECPIVALYTAAGIPVTQALAYSNDGGMTLEKFADNPVIGNITKGNRDPKVIWHEESGKWVMALYLEKNSFCLFTSTDLKDWKRTCDIVLEGCMECPDLFPLAVDGDKKNIKWVFWGGNGTYVIGDFDGKTFTPEIRAQKGYAAGSAYAGQTWSDIPKSDGRRIHIAWLKADFGDMPFNHQMTFPVEFTLRTTGDGLKLFAWPIREIKSLYRKTQVIKNKQLTSQGCCSFHEGESVDIHGKFEIGDADEIWFEFGGNRFSYDCERGVLDGFGKEIPFKPVDGEIDVRVLVDRASIEVFGGEGRVYVPYGKLNKGGNEMKISVAGGEACIRKMVINELDSIFAGRGGVTSKVVENTPKMVEKTRQK